MTTRRKITKVSELEIGKVYRYISNGFKVYGNGEAPETVSINAEYDCTVVGIYPHTITLRIKADQSTLHRMCIWDSVPYNWSILRRDLERGFERLYEEVYR